jgi:hypothetical protein
MVFDLLFMAFFLGSAIALITALILMIRGRRRIAIRLLRAMAAGWGAYLSIVALVAVATPQQIVSMGQDLCFDEMCFAVDHAETAMELGPAGRQVKANGVFQVVTVRVTNHSLGRTESEGGLRALLWDGGKSYETSREGQRALEAAKGETPRLTARLQSGESVESTQVFDLPAESANVGLVLSHGFTPGYFVIGESPLFHKPTVLRIAP